MKTSVLITWKTIVLSVVIALFIHRSHLFAFGSENIYDANLTLSAQSSSERGEGFADIIAPINVLGPTESPTLLFLSPRAIGSSEEFYQGSLGLGMRRLLPNTSLLDSSWILGGSLYYDLANSANEKNYNQVGFYVEALSDWVDVRAFYHIPESKKELIDRQKNVSTTSSTTTQRSSTVIWDDPFATTSKVVQPFQRITRQTDITTTTTTTRHFERFEAAREGGEAEIGLRIPGLHNLFDTRAFVGWTHYQSRFGGSDIDDYKARIESRPFKGLALDAEFTNDPRLRGGEQWFFGARFNVSLGGNFRDNLRDAFSRQPRTLHERLTENVVRREVVMEESDYLENLRKRTIETSTSSDTRVVGINRGVVTLAHDVIFVDPHNAINDDASASGYYEDPFTSIEAGLSKAEEVFNDIGAVCTVYICGEEPSYQEELTISGYGVAIRTSNVGFQGYGGKHYEGHTDCPILVGDIGVIDAPFVSIRGMEFIPGQETAIALQNVARAIIQDNIINNSDKKGIEIRTAVDSDILIDHNLIGWNGEEGVRINPQESAQVNLIMTNNTIASNGADGVEIILYNTSNLNAWIAHNQFNNNSDFGLSVTTQNATQSSLQIVNNSLSWNNAGIAVVNGNSGATTGTIANNSFSGPALGDGILYLEGYGTTSQTLDIRENTFAQHSNKNAIFAVTGNSAEMNHTIANNNFMFFDGLEAIYLRSRTGSTIQAMITGNRFGSGVMTGLHLDLQDSSNQVVTFSDNTLNDVQWGVRVDNFDPINNPNPTADGQVDLNIHDNVFLRSAAAAIRLSVRDDERIDAHIGDNTFVLGSGNTFGIHADTHHMGMINSYITANTFTTNNVGTEIFKLGSANSSQLFSEIDGNTVVGTWDNTLELEEADTSHLMINSNQSNTLIGVYDTEVITLDGTPSGNIIFNDADYNL